MPQEKKVGKSLFHQTTSSILSNAAMGTGKKEKNRKIREGKVGDGMANVKTKGENFYRSAKKVKALNVLTKGKAMHNARGEQTQAAVFQSRQVPQARVEPNRKVSDWKWYNSRASTNIVPVVYELPSDLARCAGKLSRRHGRTS
jgi:hypothetical protein